MIVILISLVLPASVLLIALLHNPQGEFYGSELGINWMAIAMLLAVPFVVSFSVLRAAILLVTGIGKLKGSQKKRKSELENGVAD